MGASVLSYAVYATVVAMRKTMQYRMYPTASQQHLLDETLDTYRLVYDQTLAHRSVGTTAGHALAV